MLTKPLATTVVRRYLASLGFECRTTWSQLHRQLDHVVATSQTVGESMETSAATLFALDKEGAATAATSAQDRDVLSHSLVRQRVAALEAQLRQLVQHSESWPPERPDS
eukprot:447541-Amphidinium_carterae.3